MPQIKRNKISRNSKCPCNSGKKYKHCHGPLADTHKISSPPKEKEELKALEIQKKLQQGLGRPIISAEQDDYRFVAVANKVHRGKWITFHDFLCDYIKICMGSKWGNDQLEKPEKDQHPLIKLYKIICDYQKSFIKTPGIVQSAPFTGAASAYTWLSYNLYLIAHNVTLQESLINRLRNTKQFPGAYYETYVAAVFIKAGFTLEFEDESDKSTSHCEFTATHKQSGKKYSVEAKLRHRKSLFCPDASSSSAMRIGTPLHKALEKRAMHERIIFIDLSLSMSEMANYKPDHIVKMIKKHENDLINGSVAPPAYLFITNHPYHYDLEGTDHQIFYLAEGFRIPDFGNKEVTLHEAIQTRKQHQPINDLWESIKTHNTIPVTFDGEIPEFAFSDRNERLILGQKYSVRDAAGNKQTVELHQATVDEKNEKAWGLCKNSDGQFHLIEFPLTPDEVTAYKQNPDTFFGVYRRQGKMLNNPLETYDFFMNSLSKLSKEKLLEYLKGHFNHEDLLLKTRDELLEIYCEGLANGLGEQK